jgi:hypothetical protein
MEVMEESDQEESKENLTFNEKRKRYSASVGLFEYMTAIPNNLVSHW